MRRRSIFAFLILAVALTAGAAMADGILLPIERRHTNIIVPDQLFTVKYHHVNVTIDNQVSTTKVDQIFHNDSGVEREGMYVFPMPEGSAITRFSMFAGEQEIKGKILDKKEARSIYESIVRQRKDPALLEYIDRNTFRASVYPIPANGDKRIRLDYSEIVHKTGNTLRYVYPLSTERFSARPLEDCKVTIRITSKRAISNIYSPTHTVKVDRVSDNEATVKWSASNVKPNTDLVLYYTVSDDDMGMDLVAHKTGEKGFYMLLASPRVEIDKTKLQTKNVVFVLDRTGSMAGEKIEQAKAALTFCLNCLRAGDRFNVITFNETPDPMFGQMQTATAANKKKAVDGVEEIEATGGTNIDEALSRAYAQFNGGSVRNYLVFITDGLPTVGETDINTILQRAKANNKNNVKTFAFGVGYDVNTHLLDTLSLQNKGDADYVRPKEDIEVKISSFFSKVADPILTDVKLSITLQEYSSQVLSAKASDSFPNDIPDLFKGSQLIVFGRYSGSGPVKVVLSGTANGARKSFVLDSRLPGREDSNEFIPQLWASRKIGYLLDQIRLHSNQELIDEVVRLSKEYGIPTEFTSFFADDRKISADLSRALDSVAPAMKSASGHSSGSYGVAQSQNARGMRNQAQAPQSYDFDAYAGAGKPAPEVVGSIAANGRVGGVYFNERDEAVVVANVQNVAGRTFYQRGSYWEDANLKETQQFVQIKQFSDAHFKLLRAYPKLAQYSTLGNARIVLENNQAIEIGPEGKEQLSDEEVKGLLKSASLDSKPAQVGSSGRLLGALAALSAVGLSIPASRRLRRRG
ncbi:MAG: VIT domain-containing protein [Armatimonadota bacterium]|nr:VIT domain-containing protein [Armatimonadota bacterium]